MVSLENGSNRASDYLECKRNGTINSMKLKKGRTKFKMNVR